MGVDLETRPGQVAPAPRRSVGRREAAWLWALLGAAAAVYSGWLTRFGGPTVLDPDEHASALYFDRLLHGQLLEETVYSTPKPLLTVVHGLGWTLFHDWRVGAALTIVALAVAVVTFARTAARVSGPVAAVLTALLLLGWAELSVQVGRGNSVIWVMAFWGVAADALVARGGRGTAGAPVPTPAPGARPAGARSAIDARPDAPPAQASASAQAAVSVPASASASAQARAAVPASARAGAGPRWGIAAVALVLAGLARSETWLLLPVPALFGLLAWRRGDRRGLLLLLPLLSPALWALHDELLTGSALYSVHVPAAYTDVYPPGRRPIPPQTWARWMLRYPLRSQATTLLAALAGLGGLLLLLRRRAVGLVLAAAVPYAGMWALLGRYVADGVYISNRYYLLPDVALRGLAVFGLAVPLDLLAARLGSRRRAVRLGSAGVCMVAGALAFAFLMWPLAPVNDGYRTAQRNDILRSRLAAEAVEALRPVADQDGTVILAPSLVRNRIAVELGLPVTRVRDDLLTVKVAKGQRFDEQLVRALPGLDAVVVNGRDSRYARLAVTVPTRFGADTVVPLRVDRSTGLYVLQVQHGTS